jgi:hypothetical protein
MLAQHIERAIRSLKNRKNMLFFRLMWSKNKDELQEFGRGMEITPLIINPSNRDRAVFGALRLGDFC